MSKNIIKIIWYAMTKKAFNILVVWRVKDYVTTSTAINYEESL